MRAASTGFTLSAGSFHTIDYPNSAGTSANGESNTNVVVGLYVVPSVFNDQGFVLSGGTFSSLN